MPPQLSKRLLVSAMLAWLVGTYSVSRGPEDPNRCLAQERPIGPVAENNLQPEPELRIGSGDLLEIKVYSVYGVPDIDQKSRVSNTGDISLPLVGGIHVAALTAEEAESRIEQKFKNGQYLKNPHASIFVAEYSTQGVSVYGEVAKPGIYPLVSPRNLSDMISVAGGLTPSAGNLVTITRRRPPYEQVRAALFVDGKSQHVPIFPGDTVVVEKTGIVYVLGEVGKPGGFPLNNRTGLSVLKAIALAEGIKPNAALNASKIIRKTKGDVSEVQIPLKKVLAGKSPDLPLSADDILFVPGSAAKGAARRSLEAIIEAATGVAIYRPIR